MAYTIPPIDHRLAIDPEFDTLDWQLRNREFETVRSNCNAILAAPDNSLRRVSWASLLLAEVAIAESDHTTAEALLQHVVDLPDPLRVRLATGRCEALLDKGEVGEAAHLAKALIEQHGDSWRAWEAVGKVRQEQGDDEGAWLALVRSVQLNPAAFSPVTLLVNAASTTERMRELAPLLRAHLDAQPVQIQLRVELFSSYVHRGEIEKAIDQGQRVVAFAPVTVIDSASVDTVKEALNRLYQLPQAE
jgi:predicted Zn-dependent protease